MDVCSMIQGRRNRPDRPDRGLAWISKCRGYLVIIFKGLTTNYRSGLEKNQFRRPCDIMIKK